MMAGRCERCGSQGSDVRVMNDPYAADVLGKLVEVVFCGSCAHESAQDI